MRARIALLSCSLMTAATLGATDGSHALQFKSMIARIELRVATVHAAALTSTRAPGDSTDAPYVLISIVGPRAKSHALTFPAVGHWHIRRDQALGTFPVEIVKLRDGDSARVIVTVMEGGRSNRDIEDRAAANTASEARADGHERNRVVSAAVKPLVTRGARWIGSATLLLTREAGVSYWRGLDCVASCKVISGAATASLDPAGAPAASGVIELSGAGATYHVKLETRAQR